MQVLKRQVAMSIKVLLLVFPVYAVAEWPDEVFRFLHFTPYVFVLVRFLNEILTFIQRLCSTWDQGSAQWSGKLKKRI